MTHGGKCFSHCVLRDLCPFAGRRFTLSLPRHIVKREDPNEVFVLVQHGQPPHLIVAHQCLGLADAVVRVTGDHLMRHGDRHGKRPELLTLRIRGHRNITICYNTNEAAVVNADDRNEATVTPHISWAARLRVSDSVQTFTSRVINFSTFISDSPWSPFSLSADDIAYRLPRQAALFFSALPFGASIWIFTSFGMASLGIGAVSSKTPSW